jgi:hypothetical protein
VYYVKMVTRSSGGSAKGTPRRAIDYITDSHDARRDPGCSRAELRYIVRLGEGWKTEMEGGRVPLVGFGILADLHDPEELASRFEGACQPWHDKRGTTGYKSFMDGRIFEVASGFGGEGWTAKGFLELAPDQKRWVARYEKRGRDPQAHRVPDR